MAGGTSGVNTGRRGRRLQTLLFIFALVGIAITTAVGYLIALRLERHDADERAEDTAAAAASSTATIIGRAADALGGASAVVADDGTLDLAAFDAFANDLARNTSGHSVALLTVVERDGRDSFEGQIGGPIVRATATGRLVPAGPADRYYPVLRLLPEAGAFSVVGFDYGSDVVRRSAVEQAASEGVAVVTGPTRLAATGEPGIIVLHPLFQGGTGGDVAGFVASALPVSELVAALRSALPPGTEFRIVDAGETVAASGDAGGSRSMRVGVDLPGREWRVTVEPPDPQRPDVSLVALLIGVAVWVGVLALYIVTARHQRRLDRVNRSLAHAEYRSQTLERLASRLSRSLSGAEVAGALLESLPGLTGASGGAVAVLSSDGEQLDLVAGTGYGGEQESRLGRVPLDEGSAVTTVVRDREAAFLSSPLAWRHDPTLERYAEIGMAVAVIPLVADDVRGVLVVSQPSVRRFSDEERSLLVTVGALAGRALDRSLRYDAEHATAVAFQRASLPAALPDTGDVEVAVRYRPASSTASVGGDWYDVLRLDDGRIAVVIGDVVGHGVTAAAAMAQLRAAVRVLASVLPEPVTMLRSLASQVPPIADTLGATMAYGIVDPAGGTFDYFRAGHLPPLLLRADGGSEFLSGEPWPPLGVSPQSEPATHTVALNPGDTLLLYTDGVAERRGESLSVGLERLRAAAAVLGDLEPGDLCDALLEAIVPSDDQADDVALLALRLAPAAAHLPAGDAVPLSANP